MLQMLLVAARCSWTTRRQLWSYFALRPADSTPTPTVTQTPALQGALPLRAAGNSRGDAVRGGDARARRPGLGCDALRWRTEPGREGCRHSAGPGGHKASVIAALPMSSDSGSCSIRRLFDRVLLFAFSRDLVCSVPSCQNLTVFGQCCLFVPLICMVCSIAFVRARRPRLNVTCVPLYGSAVLLLYP